MTNRVNQTQVDVDPPRVVTASSPPTEVKGERDIVHVVDKKEGEQSFTPRSGANDEDFLTPVSVPPEHAPNGRDGGVVLYGSGGVDSGITPRGIDPLTGEELYQVSISPTVKVAKYDPASGYVIWADLKGGPSIWAIDPSDGSVVWSNLNFGASTRKRGPVIDSENGIVAAASNPRNSTTSKPTTAYFFNISDGSTAYSSNTLGSGYTIGLGGMCNSVFAVGVGYPDYDLFGVSTAPGDGGTELWSIGYGREKVSFFSDPKGGNFLVVMTAAFGTPDSGYEPKTIDAQTGTEIASASSADNRGYNEVKQGRKQPDNYVELHDRQMVVFPTGQDVAAFHIPDATLQWSRDYGDVGSVMDYSGSADLIYFPNGDTLYAIDPDTGETVYTTPLPSGNNSLSPTQASAFHDPQNIYAINDRDGSRTSGSDTTAISGVGAGIPEQQGRYVSQGDVWVQDQ